MTSPNNTMLGLALAPLRDGNVLSNPKRLNESVIPLLMPGQGPIGRIEMFQCMYSACGCDLDPNSSHYKCKHCQNVFTSVGRFLSRKLFQFLLDQELLEIKESYYILVDGEPVGDSIVIRKGIILSFRPKGVIGSIDFQVVAFNQETKIIEPPCSSLCSPPPKTFRVSILTKDVNNGNPNNAEHTGNVKDLFNLTSSILTKDDNSGNLSHAEHTENIKDLFDLTSDLNEIGIDCLRHLGKNALSKCSDVKLLMQLSTMYKEQALAAKALAAKAAAARAVDAKAGAAEAADKAAAAKAAAEAAAAIVDELENPSKRQRKSD